MINANRDRSSFAWTRFLCRVSKEAHANSGSPAVRGRNLGRGGNFYQETGCKNLPAPVPSKPREKSIQKFVSSLLDDVRSREMSFVLLPENWQRVIDTFIILVLLIKPLA